MDVHLDSRFCGPKQRLRKQPHAQIGGARIQSVDRLESSTPRSTEA
jgi:hypothetical protein